MAGRRRAADCPALGQVQPVTVASPAEAAKAPAAKDRARLDHPGLSAASCRRQVSAKARRAAADLCWDYGSCCEVSFGGGQLFCFTLLRALRFGDDEANHAIVDVGGQRV